MEKINVKLFEQKFEIHFSEPQTFFSGTSKVLFNHRQAFLKEIATRELIETNIYVTDVDYGRFLVLEKFCSFEED